MKSTVVIDGEVRCPVCGANQFSDKRTGKAKWAGVATLGVGVLAMPKRLKCRGCGENLKRGEPPKAAKPPSAWQQAKAQVEAERAARPPRESFRRKSSE